MKTLKPVHFAMIRLFWEGRSYREIAEMLDYTSQQVMNVLHSEDAKNVLQQMQELQLDTMSEVATELQLMAPELIQRKKKIALYSPDEHVANRAATDLLFMAGHTPVKRVQVQQTLTATKYDSMTEEQLREALLSDVNEDGKGPDGRPLN
jgi:ribosomal protein S13